MTVSNYFTKFGWAKALPTKEAVLVVSALRELLFTMGMPTVITTDQGKEFHNQFNAEMMNVLGIKHGITTTYHPQANSLDECYNQTLVNILAKFAEEDHHTWDRKLSELVYTYNTAVHDSTKCIPFETVFERQARLPVDFNIKDHYSPEEMVQEHEAAEEPSITEMRAMKRKTEEVVKLNIEIAQAKPKAYYDKKHRASNCLEKNFKRKKRCGGKLDYHWKGPFVITNTLGKGLFELKQLVGDKIVKG